MAHLTSIRLERLEVGRENCSPREGLRASLERLYLVSPRPCGSGMMNPRRTGDAAWASALRPHASACGGLPRRSGPRDLLILKYLIWHVWTELVGL